MHHLVVVPAVSPNDGGALAGGSSANGMSGTSDANGSNGPGVNGGAPAGVGGVSFPGRFAPSARIPPVHGDLGGPAVTEWAVRQLVVDKVGKHMLDFLDEFSLDFEVRTVQTCVNLVDPENC